MKRKEVNGMKRKAMTVAFCHRACDSWGMSIASTDVKFICNDLDTNESVMGLKSPLTNQWMTFRVSHKALRSNQIPLTLQPMMAYYLQTKALLECARAFQPMNHDLTALCAEEAHMLCVVQR